MTDGGLEDAVWRALNMPTTHQQKGGGHNKFKVGDNGKAI